LIVPAGKGRTFEKNVRNLLADQSDLASILLPMLDAWRGIRTRAAERMRPACLRALVRTGGRTRHLRGVSRDLSLVRAALPPGLTDQEIPKPRT